MIVATTDPVQFDSLRLSAERLRTSLDRTWACADADAKQASWCAEWHAGDIDVDVYWSDPSRDEAPVDAAIHLAFNPHMDTNRPSGRG